MLIAATARTQISFEQFGATGNGQDETANLLKAFAEAKKKKLPIHLADGKTYKFSPGQTVDITGIPAFTGNGTIDCSSAGANAGNKSLLAIFQVTGTKQMIGNLQDLKKSQKEFTIKAGLDLVKGAVLFLTSAEPLPSAKRDYYAKGQRLVVNNYNRQTGKLGVEQSLSYDYGNACLWWNSFQPTFKVEKGVRFITSPMNFLTCIRLYYAKADISGYYKNFALTAIMYKSSEGVVNEMEADLPITGNNGYSHCVEIADMSYVVVRNSRLSGGRHVISGCAGGLWEKEECGGKGHAGYPSVMIVDGGIYKGSNNVPGINADNATLDSHGVVDSMMIKNCTVYGGINLGSDYADISDVTIYTDQKRAFNVGSDVQPGSSWGNYNIRNVNIYTDAESKIPVFISKADVRNISLMNVQVDNLPPGAALMDFRYNAPKKIDITDSKVNNGARDNMILINQGAIINIKKSNLTEKSIKRMNY